MAHADGGYDLEKINREEHVHFDAGSYKAVMSYGFDGVNPQQQRVYSRTAKGQQQTTITSSTSETTIVTADATYFLDLYGLILTNTSATVTKVTIKDATSGTTRAVLEVPPTDTRGFMLRSLDAMGQSAINNNWTATCGTSVAALEVTALYLKTL
jgi:hypothetical protein